MKHPSPARAAPYAPPVGHRGVRDRLARLVSSGRVPGALLLHGPHGVGKSAVAAEFARTLFCRSAPAPYGGCASCPACAVTDAGNAPDLLRLDVSTKEGGSVDAVRGVLRSLGLRAFHGGSRVVLLEGCDHLSVPAANVLLKALEEPAGGTVFLLVCTNPSRLPRTVLSRVHPFGLGPLSDDELGRVLAYAAPEASAEEIARVVPLAEGSAGAALLLLRSEADVSGWEAKLSAVAGGDVALAVELARTIGKEKDALGPTLSVLRSVGRRRLLRGGADQERRRWAVFVGNVVDAERLVRDRNLNPAAVFTTVFLSLAHRPGAFRGLRSDALELRYLTL